MKDLKDEKIRLLLYNAHLAGQGVADGYPMDLANEYANKVMETLTEQINAEPLRAICGCGNSHPNDTLLCSHCNGIIKKPEPVSNPDELRSAEDEKDGAKEILKAMGFENPNDNVWKTDWFGYFILAPEATAHNVAEFIYKRGLIHGREEVYTNLSKEEI